MPVVGPFACTGVLPAGACCAASVPQQSGYSYPLGLSAANAGATPSPRAATAASNLVLMVFLLIPRPRLPAGPGCIASSAMRGRWVSDPYGIIRRFGIGLLLKA